MTEKEKVRMNATSAKGGLIGESMNPSGQLWTSKGGTPIAFLQDDCCLQVAGCCFKLSPAVSVSRTVKQALK